MNFFEQHFEYTRKEKDGIDDLSLSYGIIITPWRHYRVCPFMSELHCLTIDLHTPKYIRMFTIYLRKPYAIQQEEYQEDDE